MRLSIIAASAALAIAAGLSGCAGFTLPGVSGANANKDFYNFLTDPNCAHHDEATLVTGAAGMPASFQAKVSRDCPARPATGAAPVAPPAGTPAPTPPSVPAPAG